MKKRIKNIVTYLWEAYENKILAMGLIIVGTIVLVVMKDGTMLIFGLMFGVPMILFDLDDEEF